MVKLSASPGVAGEIVGRHANLLWHTLPQEFLDGFPSFLGAVPEAGRDSPFQSDGGHPENLSPELLHENSMLGSVLRTEGYLLYLALMLCDASPDTSPM